MTGPELTAAVREQLDAATYEALAAAINAKARAADQAGYARALQERAGVLRLADALSGLARSWTGWASALLIALPELLPMVQADLPAILGEHAANRVMQACGVLMLVLRLKTDRSVWAKAAQRTTEAPR